MLMNKKANNTNLVIVLGKQLDKSGKMSKDLINILDNATEYYQNTPNTRLLVCGKYSINYDWQGFSPKYYESIEMKKYLIAKGIPAYIIATENSSKDTIGNVYYAKQYIKKHPSITEINVFCTTLHKQRVKILFNKFFESSYKITYKTVDTKTSSEDIFKEKLELQTINSEQSIIKNIQGGNDTDFKYSLYRNKFYRR